MKNTTAYTEDQKNTIDTEKGSNERVETTEITSNRIDHFLRDLQAIYMKDLLVVLLVELHPLLATIMRSITIIEAIVEGKLFFFQYLYLVNW